MLNPFGINPRPKGIEIKPHDNIKVKVYIGGQLVGKYTNPKLTRVQEWVQETFKKIK